MKGLVLLLVLWASVASAQEMTLLSRGYEERLNDQARLIYQDGVAAYNFVLYDRATDLFFQAMQADPRHIRLRFLVGRMATDRANVKLGEEALRYLYMAREAHQGITAMPNLRSEDRHRAEAALQDSLTLIAGMPKRDARREATGIQVIQAIAQERELFAQTPLSRLGVGSSFAREFMARSPEGSVRQVGSVAPAATGVKRQAGVRIVDVGVGSVQLNSRTPLTGGGNVYRVGRYAPR